MKFERIYNIKKREPDYYIILIDGLWPRGIKKELVDLWMKEIAPSDELRKWYSHRDERCQEFRERYIQELGKKGDLINKLIDISRSKNIILAYASKDDCNNATVLEEYIRDLYGPEYLQ